MDGRTEAVETPHGGTGLGAKTYPVPGTWEADV
jgi:hypothetical protein